MALPSSCLSSSSPVVVRRPPSSSPHSWSYLLWLHKWRWAVMVGCALLLAGLSPYALGAFGALSDNGFEDTHGDAYRTATAISKHFAFPDPDVVVLFESKAYTVDDPAFQSVYKQVKTALQTLPTFGFLSYFDYPDSQSGLLSDDRHRALLYLKVKKSLTNEELAGAVPAALQADDAVVKVTIGGRLVFMNDVVGRMLKDLTKAESLSLPFVIVIMIFTFRGLVASLCPILVAVQTIVWSMALLHAFTTHWHVTLYAAQVVTMMGLALSIDYSLFIVGRFLSEKTRRPAAEDIVVVMDRVMSTSGRTIQFSAITVFISLTGSFVFHEYFIGSIALAILCISACTCLICSVFLPALLYCLDHHVFRLSTDPLWAWAGRAWRRIRCGRESESAKAASSHGPWYHIAHFAMRYPWPILLAALAVFGGLTAVFFAQVDLGMADANVLPAHAPARVVFNAQMNDFSKLGRGGELNIYLHTKAEHGVLQPAFLTELDALATKVTQLPGVSDVSCQVRHVGSGASSLNDYLTIYADPMAHVSTLAPLADPFLITDFDHVSRVAVSMTYDSFSTANRHAVKQLRSMLASSSSLTALLDDYGVTSYPATVTDLMSDMQVSTPTWAVLLVTAIYLLVLVMTASPFLAAKAVLTSIFSLGGAFGLIVLMFQAGAGRPNGLGMTPCGYLPALQLILVFTIAFGLGVDYELFLLASIQEWYHRLGDHREAIAEGLDRAGRYVTLAAILLATVVGSFVLSSVTIIKMLGFGIATCVVLDATIVRSCVVPTVLIAAGEKVVWWSPRGLKECVLKLGLSERILDDDDDDDDDDESQANQEDQELKPRSHIATPGDRADLGIVDEAKAAVDERQV